MQNLQIVLMLFDLMYVRTAAAKRQKQRHTQS